MFVRWNYKNAQSRCEHMCVPFDTRTSDTGRASHTPHIQPDMIWAVWLPLTPPATTTVLAIHSFRFAMARRFIVRGKRYSPCKIAGNFSIRKLLVRLEKFFDNFVFFFFFFISLSPFVRSFTKSTGKLNGIFIIANPSSYHTASGECVRKGFCVYLIRVEQRDAWEYFSI